MGMVNTARFDTRSALYRAARDKVESLRKSVGWTQKELARRAGISHGSYREWASQGGWMSPEVARRLLGAFMGEDFSNRPKARYRQRIPKSERVSRDVFWTKEEFEKLEAEARRCGIGVQTLIHIAVQRFIDDAPPLNTIARVAKSVAPALARAELEENEALQHILDMDPDVAMEEAKRAPTMALTDAEKADVPMRQILTNSHNFFDGYAEQVYLEETDREEYERWMREEGMEEL